MEVRQVETLERDPAVAPGCVLQLLERATLEFAVGQGDQSDEVDLDAGRVKPDTDPLGNDALMRVVVDEAPQLRKAPAQRVTRIVGNFPQQFAQLLATAG